MLECCNVSVLRGKKTVLKDVSFSVAQGCLTVLIGKNGSGKTTLLSAINGELSYTGQIRLDDTDLTMLSPRARAQRIAFLPQVLRTPHISTEELVGMGRAPYWELGKRPSEADHTAVTQAMRAMGIEELKDRRLDSLSGGERQKAYLAMTLAQQTPLLLLDEPTTYMDPAVSHAMVTRLKELRDRDQKTLLVVMHDLNAAIRCADRIAVLEQGRLAFYGTREQCLMQEVIERSFSVRRFEADGHIFFEGEETEARHG